MAPNKDNKAVANNRRTTSPKSGADNARTTSPKSGSDNEKTKVQPPVMVNNGKPAASKPATRKSKATDQTKAGTAKSEPERQVNSSQPKPESRKKTKAASYKTDAKTGRKRPGAFKTGTRAIMLTLMVAYTVAALVIGYVLFINFFSFYLTEKSPVMGVNTESSRIKDIEIFDNGTIQKGIDAIMGAEIYVETVTVRQVGPSLHFYVVVPEGDDVNAGRDKGNRVLEKFSEAIERPRLYNTHEAQVIVTKAKLPELEKEVLLRPAKEDGAEQAFPQFAVRNNRSEGTRWSRNGE
ncbi:MAG: hypothetical protein ACRC6X_06815 [Culicoidibacterales bacterium]